VNGKYPLLKNRFDITCLAGTYINPNDAACPSLVRTLKR
jgi:hypothetical protein